MDTRSDEFLRQIAAQVGTPAYVYFLDEVVERIEHLRMLFDRRFEISFAIKSNPNITLLKALSSVVDTADASSGGEVERALAAGYASARITFSGPAKREFELKRAVDVGCGLVVCESLEELTSLNTLAAAAGRTMNVAIRINPRRAPKRFGVNMAGKPSQFGIDEEALPAAAASRRNWTHLALKGFHIYSGTNSLSDEAIAENFGIFSELFVTAAALFQVEPEVLIFGSGFGIPYQPDQTPLDVRRLAERVNPLVDSLLARPEFRATRCALEMGRYLVGPAGYFLTSIINLKCSRGVEIGLCDGGFNNHLAAFGLMGTVIRRNWPMWNISASAGAAMKKYMLVGPLCTTIDTLAQDVELAALSPGDVIAVGASGAYGLSASPVFFISHPAPREFLVSTGDAGLDISDITEITSERALVVGH